MARARVRTLLDGAVITAETGIAYTLASHALSRKRARAWARDDGAILAIEASVAEASAVACAFTIARAGIGAVFILTGNAMIASHANALAFTLGALSHAQAMTTAVIVARLHRAVTSTKTLLASTSAVVAMTLARTLIRAGNELAGITSVARVGRLGALADSLHTLATAIAICLAELNGAIDATEALAAYTVLGVRCQLAMLNRATASEAVGACPSLVANAKTCLDVHRTFLIAVDSLTVHAGECSVTNALAVNVVSMVRTCQLLTSLSCEASVTLADTVDAVTLATAVFEALSLLTVDAAKSSVANALAVDITSMSRALKGGTVLACKASVALASAIDARTLSGAVLDA